ncbi:acetylcholine receptor subunit alpha-like 2 [Elysia marginata]|uniref:Acetylcholine receptor subunit alpha-like 2 n=1 Tax=Elysia marginata TaxID=1093978 RepID=A0AAV4EM60_9GAST|nr:acetylcholine receptor subunit alpha-like 2 [Elysia marginata]
MSYFFRSIKFSNSLRTAGVCLLLLVLIAPCDSSTDPERDAYRRVKMDLLSHPYAVDKIPPKVNSTENIDIEIGFTPQQILYVNEAQMTVTVSATLSVIWHEPAFTWDSTNTSVFVVSVSTNDIWTPILMNPLTIDSDDLIIDMPSQLRVHHTGKIHTVQKFTITVSCSFDMEWFPFDEQICLFPIMPYNGDSANLNTLPDPDADMAIRIDGEDNQGDWSWEKVTPKLTFNDVEVNTDLTKNMTFVSFEVLMKRRSVRFYMTNVVFPVGATAVLTLGVFLIPAVSGEKISYLISIFISSTVFLSSLTTTMSKGQENTCRFNLFIVAVTTKIILATAASMFVLHRFAAEQEQKEEEVTASPSDQTGGFNSTVGSPSRQNGASMNRVRVAVCDSRSSSTPSSHHQKVDAFERPAPTPPPSPTEQRSAKTTSRPKKAVAGISRFWRKGYRLSSSELDWMFLAMFLLASIIAYPVIMRAPNLF